MTQGVPVRQGERRGQGQRGRSTTARSSRPGQGPASRRERAPALGEELPAGQRASARRTGHPLFVGGPQIGYFYPGLTLEMDIRARASRRAAATVPGCPGNILIGRGPGLRVEPHLGRLGHERPVRRDALRRLEDEVHLQGQVPQDGHGQRRHDQGPGPVKYHTTVHGPVTGYAKVRGKRVAISRKRSSYGQDILWQIDVQRPDDRQGPSGRGRSAAGRTRRSRSTSATPTTTTSRCTRPGSCRSATSASTRACPRRAPASTSGRASCTARKHPHAGRTRRAASSSTGTTGRRRVRRRRRQVVVRLDPARADAAGQHRQSRARPGVGHVGDERGRDAGPAQRRARRPLGLLAAAPAPSARAAQMLELLEAWRAAGSSRLDATSTARWTPARRRRSWTRSTRSWPTR